MEKFSFRDAGIVLILAGIALPFCVSAFAQPPVRPEHPNPQMMRADWINLNGAWEFAETDDDTSFLNNATYPDRIVVPFCRESALSGLGRTGFIKHIWYRRQFEIPASWDGNKVLLHVGACDWKTSVYVNNAPVGEHTGGSAAFSFDITAALTPGKNTLVIHAFDDTRSGLQTCGKQSQKRESYGCLYTRTTGIWQTVWLEAVGQTSVKRFEAVPDLKGECLRLKIYLDNPGDEMTLSAVAKANGNEAGRIRITGQGTPVGLDLPVPQPRLWSVKDPFLYELELTVLAGDTVLDRVSSYFGMREIEIKGRAILLNGEPVFQRLVLDQGFYPDGIWTAPTEEALENDILLSQAAGFNGARLHQKVFEPRFLYWADKLGYLVWGEFPNWGMDYEKEAAQKPVIAEWEEIVYRDFNHPSIIGWCPFNETPPSAAPLQKVVVDLTRRIDLTRPVLESSGYAHAYPEPMLLDAHDYDQNPESFGARWATSAFETALPVRYGSGPAAVPVPFFVSEYGGIGWNLNPEAWGYGNTPASLDAFYARYDGLTKVLLDNRYMFGFCYTQLTNVEQEQNGIYNYDRTPKFDIAPIRASNTRPSAYEQNPPVEGASGNLVWTVLVGAQSDGDQAATWRYTEAEAPDGWEQPGFDDANWKEGKGAFGHKDGFEKFITTPWKGRDIRLRSTFTYEGGSFDKAMLVIHYDNDTTVYLNGKPLFAADKWNDAYRGVDVTDTVRTLLQDGENTIAVHTRQDTGGQFIDLALLIGAEAE
ncbi:MAG: Beta-glucuronidase [Candidatus Hydrogenedentes bacterium ADurb.Bin179]|nr:MAG: Beta-glucuronidase [Candidatus Hydrogenedentes bacterium ADurb.Bin179]